MDNERLYDIRALKQRLRTGRISWEQYQAHLAEFPDEADEGTETSVHFSPSWALRHDGEAAPDEDTASEAE